MFSNDEQKLKNLLKVKKEYTQRVSKNVEKLTRQIQFLDQINKQIGGADKSAQPAQPARSAKSDKKDKQEKSTDDIDVVESQISKILIKAQLEHANKQVSGDMANKL